MDQWSEQKTLIQKEEPVNVINIDRNDWYYIESALRLLLW